MYAVSLHPGVVNTEIMRSRDNQSIFTKILLLFLRPLVGLFGISSADGAKTTIHCATSEDIPNQSGLYFV